MAVAPLRGVETSPTAGWAVSTANHRAAPCSALFLWHRQVGMKTINGSLRNTDEFVQRHLGPREADIREMLDAIGYESLDALVEAALPPSIRLHEPLAIGEAASEYEALAELREIASKNQIFRSYLGMGYHDMITPPVIQRNILENPGWYTPYTPYQAEISQGRLEALLELPDDGHRPDGAADRERVAPRRGDGRRRGDGDEPGGAGAREAKRLLRLRATATRRRSRSSRRGHGRAASRSSSAITALSSSGRTSSAGCSSSRRRMARSTTTAISASARTRPARS